MKFRALSIGAFVGFVFAMAPSCGGTTCGPANCAGCCDSSGKCVAKPASGTNSTCGAAGNTCVDCTKSNQVCSTSFTCLGTTGGGAGGGTAGGTAGGSAGGTAGGSAGGSAGGTGGGSAGGTGGGTAGGSAGGAGGGTAGGSAGGSGGGSATCDISAQNCSPGSSCMISGLSGGSPTFSCFPGVCDIVTQNCATSTDKCTYVPGTTVARGCVAAGSIVEDGTCNPQADQCAKGLACLTAQLADGGAGASTCRKYCYTASNCGSNRSCATLAQIGGTSEIPLLCTPSCSPFLQDCPTTTDGCYPSTQGNICVPAGTIADGQACTPQTLCTKGALCVTFSLSDGGTVSSCRRICNPAGSPTCASGTCQALTSPAGLGVCI